MNPRACPPPCVALLVSFTLAAGCAKKGAADPSAQAPATTPATAPAARVLRESPGPYRPMLLRVLKVDEGSITVRPRFRMEGQPPPGDQTLTLDPQQTQVFAHVVTAERETEQGQIVQSTQLRPAGFDELKVGQQVHVSSNDQRVAVDVIILPPPPDRPTTRRATTRRATTRRATTRRATTMTTRPHTTQPAKIEVRPSTP